jgi:hypothetical protein
VRETYPVEVVAIAGAALMLVLGILPAGRGDHGLFQPRAMDHRGAVHHRGRAGAHRRAGLGLAGAARNVEARPVLTLVGC